jgi:hypothetical protein
VEYVGFYRLARSEGLLLRYLTDAYRALRLTVPEAARVEELVDIIEWLGELTRQVDSSLLDEWEALSAGKVPPARGLSTQRTAEPEVRPVTANERAFGVLVRNAMFRRVELAARRDWTALGDLDGDAGWDAAAWEDALARYWDQHDAILTDADARGPDLLDIVPDLDRSLLRVGQVIHDPAGFHDWRIDAEVDLAASDAAGVAVLRVQEVGML